MSAPEQLKLTAYFGERDRVEGRLVADQLLDLFARRAVTTSVLLRGVEGFGLKHHLHTQRLLTLSEDLPLVARAVDGEDRIRELVSEVRAVMPQGLLVLERVELWDGSVPAAARREGGAVKLTVYLGRYERVGNTAAYRAVVDLLRGYGVAGATAVLAVDGTLHGRRRQARFFSRNADVPMMVEAVGEASAVSRAIPALAGTLTAPVMTLERVTVCKRDGVKLAEPPGPVETVDGGLRVWQKLSVYASEAARHADRPLYTELIRRLRLAGASGATAVRGVWGFHGDHRPHGDTLLALRRRVPVVTTVIDTAEASRGWFDIIDELTDETGLVTSELVPAMRAFGPGYGRGGTDLAPRPPPDSASD